METIPLDEVNHDLDRTGRKNRYEQQKVDCMAPDALPGSAAIGPLA